MNSKKFRDELVKIMPGYKWTVHRSHVETWIEATGIQTAGFNRLSTLFVVRFEKNGHVSYEVKSSGFGVKAPWLYTNCDRTLARALRGLQDFYEHTARIYQIHAADLVRGRKAEVIESPGG